MKIWPSIEKSYHIRKDGYYQEVISHFVHFQDSQGNTETKLDKQLLGGVYTENNTHNSFSGVVIIKEDGVEKRLVAVEK
jgi:hypothetical protein